MVSPGSLTSVCTGPTLAALTVNASEADSPTPGFSTITSAAITASVVGTKPLGTWAVRLESLTNVVESGLLFQSTIEVGLKSEPSSVRENSPVPPTISLGERLERVGFGGVYWMRSPK